MPTAYTRTFENSLLSDFHSRLYHFFETKYRIVEHSFSGLTTKHVKLKINYKNNLIEPEQLHNSLKIKVIQNQL